MIAPVNKVKDEDLDRISAWVNASAAAKMLCQDRTGMNKIATKGRLDFRLKNGKQLYYVPQLATYEKPAMGNPDRIKSDDLYLSKESRSIIKTVRDKCLADKGDYILGVRMVGSWAVLHHYNVINNKQVLVKTYRLQQA